MRLISFFDWRVPASRAILPCSKAACSKSACWNQPFQLPSIR